MMNKRKEKLMPGGIPKYVRCYDDGESIDRYTVVFTGHYNNMRPDRGGFPGGYHPFIGMSACPHAPTGVCITDATRNLVDRPTYSHLGKPIKFQSLPEPCQGVTLDAYEKLWGLDEPEDE